MGARLTSPPLCSSCMFVLSSIYRLVDGFVSIIVGVKRRKGTAARFLATASSRRRTRFAAIELLFNIPHELSNLQSSCLPLLVYLFNEIPRPWTASENSKSPARPNFRITDGESEELGLEISLRDHTDLRISFGDPRCAEYRDRIRAESRCICFRLATRLYPRNARNLESFRDTKGLNLWMLQSLLLKFYLGGGEGGISPRFAASANLHGILGPLSSNCSPSFPNCLAVELVHS